MGYTSNKPLTTSANYQLDCSAGLLPLGDLPVACCTKPSGHDGLHVTARGVQWADPDDGEDES